MTVPLAQNPDVAGNLQLDGALSSRPGRFLSIGSHDPTLRLRRHERLSSGY